VAKIKITEFIEEVSKPYLEENGLELYFTEYVKEGKDWYLRIYVDKPEGVFIKDCEDYSRWISEKLDEADPIERNYMLEVSSPGLDRPLVKDEHFEKYKGRLVDISLYKQFNGSKQITALLIGLNDNNISVNIDGEDHSFDRKEVSKVRLALDF